MGCFLIFKNVFLSLLWALCPIWASSAEAASFLGFLELQAAEAQPATPRLAQTLAFGSCEEQTNQLGKQACCFDPAYSQSVYHIALSWRGGPIITRLIFNSHASYFLFKSYA